MLTNETDEAVLVDTRGWDGSLGVAGPVAETPTGDEPARPSLSIPCPAELADDRVRIGMGRYFESGNPARILRERILGTH